MTYEEFKEKVGSVILTGRKLPGHAGGSNAAGQMELQILYELCIKCPMRFGELKSSQTHYQHGPDQRAERSGSGRIGSAIQYNVCLCGGYSLTEKGRDLLPVFYAISQWGMKYIP